ncbi:MAG: ferrous iron transport protein B [Bifidobacteriaceae bacterium]|jgi:ferrous iron transport protein B|nr:ferrous iron transport protein B [Bifidobacteriaceae bacterium]
MTITVALAGNPNCGKTTLFNALTGLHQKVGNWPRVTVERKTGTLQHAPDTTVVDLPGVYSLSPDSLEERISRDYLVNDPPDVIVNVVDATTLERNLFLTLQLLELGIPVVVALNMMDEVAKNGELIDLEKLSARLACPVLGVSALKRTGLKDLVKAAVSAAATSAFPNSGGPCRFSQPIEDGLAWFQQRLDGLIEPRFARFAAIKLLERDPRLPESLTEIANAGEAAIAATERALSDDVESAITEERYVFLGALLDGIVNRRDERVDWSDRIDAVVTNRWLALPIFAAVIFLTYYIAVTTVGTFVTDWANDGVFGEGWSLFGLADVPGVPVAVGNLLDSLRVAPWLSGLILDGIIGGVGAVLGFVPQMMVLFAILASLEACGYISRVAFILDRGFRRFGLSGKSFIPMLISTGCGIPGVMSSRTIESESDRRMTIMTTTFMPCGAKLPIIALVAGAVFNGAWWVAPSAYFVGVGAIIVSGLILKKTKPFRGIPAPFVMELPPYRWPVPTAVLRVMWERSWSFIKRAGTIILLSAVAVWFLSSFAFEGGRLVMVEDLGNGMLASLGRSIAWVFAPLGFGTWDATVATLTGLVAKENVVGTLGVLFGFAEVTEDGSEIWANFAATFTPLTGFAFLIFNLLCAPCFAAIGAIHRELNNTRWTWFAIGYQTAFAYCVALLVNQFGRLFTGGEFGVGTCFAVAVLAVIVFLAVRPVREPSEPDRQDPLDPTRELQGV